LVPLLLASPHGPDTAIRIALGQRHAEECEMRKTLSGGLWIVSVVCSPLRGCPLVWFMPVLSSGQKTDAITRFIQGCRVCYLSSCWTQPHIQTYRGAESMASHRLCFQPASDAQSNHWCVHCVKNINSRTLICLTGFQIERRCVDALSLCTCQF